MTSDDMPRDLHFFVGMRVTEDGFVHQELLPNGRCGEARGDRAGIRTGSYTVTGSHLDYADDTTPASPPPATCATAASSTNASRSVARQRIRPPSRTFRL